MIFQVRNPKSDPLRRRDSAARGHVSRFTHLSRRSRTQADHALVAPKSDAGGSRCNDSAIQRSNAPTLQRSAPPFNSFNRFNSFVPHHSAFRPPHSAFSQRGIALVITLILLSVITFMAITFLVLSTRDRGSVTTTTDQTNARLAADAALERAKTEAIALILATTNAFNYDFFVSSAYKNQNGFDPGVAGVSITNVNYDHTAAGAALTANQRLQNLANLYIDPMPPVYILNRQTSSNDFRYYIDLNRNGFFEPTGVLSLTNDLGPQMFNPTNAAIPLTEYLTGDPQWIGILERPGFPHSPSNRFVARIAYLALPA